MGLNSIMDTSLSALYAAQAGLATTGHNIANANIPGYNRQQVMYSARRPSILPHGAIGRGVNIDTIRRIQDEFLAKNLRAQTSRMETYTAVHTALADVEAILGSVDNDHLGDAMTNFFNSWNSLAAPPMNHNLKTNVVAAAQSLVRDFQATDRQLTDLQANIEATIAGEVVNLNRMLAEVADMNQQVMAAESNGQPANDLRDRRDKLILDISNLAEVSVLEREDGSKDLIMAGRTVVARGTVTLFSTIERETDGHFQAVIVTADNLREVALPPGRLAGLVESRDVHVTGVREKMDAVAAMLIDEVNALHTQGRTMNSAGLAFFTGDSLHTIGVNAALEDDPSLVATGRTTAESDNELALAIADLMNVGSGGPGSETVADRYRSSLIDVASNQAAIKFMVESQDNVVAALEARMQSVSGVSLDEEGANMIKYQNSYNAAAKVITVVQELYDSLLQMV